MQVLAVEMAPMGVTMMIRRVKRIPKNEEFFPK